MSDYALWGVPDALGIDDFGCKVPFSWHGHAGFGAAGYGAHDHSDWWF